MAFHDGFVSQLVGRSAVVDRDGFAFADVTTSAASDQKCSVSVS